MRGARFCRGARDTWSPCSRGTVVSVRFGYRGDRVAAVELFLPVEAFPRHHRALATRFGPPSAREPGDATWRLARNWRIRLERRPTFVRELHSYVP